MDAIKFLWRWYWKILWIFFRCAIILLFIIVPCMPIYSWFFPWPEAESSIRQIGVKGTLLLVADSFNSYSKRKFGEDASTGYWIEKHNRTYIAVSDSFFTSESVSYTEIKGSGIDGIKQQIGRDSWGPLITFLLWIVLGFFSVIFIRRWISLRKASINAN